MVNSFSLLLVAVIGCWAIARINRDSRLFWGLLLATTIGFVGGATASKLAHPLEKDSITAVSVNALENGNNTSTVWVVETPFAWKATTGSYSSVLSKVYYYSDIPTLTSPLVKTVHPARCLSPPSYYYKEIRLKDFIDSS